MTTHLLNSKPKNLGENTDAPTIGSGKRALQEVEIPGGMLPQPVNAVAVLKKRFLGIRELQWNAFLVRSSVESQLVSLECSKLELERARLELARERAALDERNRHLDSDRLWTDEQAATFLGLSTRWLRDSEVPKVRLPGSGRRCPVRYDPEQVQAFAKKHNTYDLTTDANVHPPKRRKGE